MKLNTTPRLAINDPLMQREFRDHAQQINALSEGKIAAKYNSVASIPTVGDSKQGDFIANKSPSLINLNGHGVDYILIGWICLSSGNPGVWNACYCHAG